MVEHENKSKSLGKGKERAHTVSPVPESSLASKSGNEDTYAKQQVQRKKEALQERDRVRALIEADKQERRARAERLRAERNSATVQEGDTAQSAGAASGLTMPSRLSQSGRCGIQIRLLDGSTIRNYFSSQSTLQRDVRPFIDEQSNDSSPPYNFKLVRTPQPSRAVQEDDERRTLEELDLVPSASLALVPVKNLAQAYQARGSKGFLKSAPALAYTYMFSLLMKLLALMRVFLGIGVEAPPDTMAASDGAATGNAVAQAKEVPSTPEKKDTDNRKIRIRTLQDKRDESKDQQLYNGNQVCT